MKDFKIFDFEVEATNYFYERTYSILSVHGELNNFSIEEKNNLTKCELVFEIELPSAPALDNVSKILVPSIRFAIKNEDIKLFDAFLTSLNAVATFSLVDSTKTMTAIVTVITALIKLGHDILNGVVLTENELIIMVILKRGGPMSQSELFAVLSIESKINNYDELSSLLEQLTISKSLTGKNVSLVGKTGNGNWFTLI